MPAYRMDPITVALIDAAVADYGSQRYSLFHLADGDPQGSEPFANPAMTSATKATKPTTNSTRTIQVNTRSCHEPGFSSTAAKGTRCCRGRAS